MERVSDKDRGGIKSERCLSDPSLSHEVGTALTAVKLVPALTAVMMQHSRMKLVPGLTAVMMQHSRMKLVPALTAVMSLSRGKFSVNNLPSTSEGPEGPTTHLSVPTFLPHPPVASSTDSSCELTTMFSQLPIKLEETADCGRPPLSEVLIEPSLVNKKKTSLNPFVKLDSRLPSVTPSLLTQPTVISGSNKQGSTPIATRKVGLSLKIRKRKFVMSPSKAQQEKPVLSKNRDKQAFSFTPPLFTTPSHPHNLTSSHSHTPSLFSPGDRNLLDQYSVTKQTPCRRYTTTSCTQFTYVLSIDKQTPCHYILTTTSSTHITIFTFNLSYCDFAIE